METKVETPTAAPLPQRNNPSDANVQVQNAHIGGGGPAAPGGRQAQNFDIKPLLGLNTNFNINNNNANNNNNNNFRQNSGRGFGGNNNHNNRGGRGGGGQRNNFNRRQDNDMGGDNNQMGGGGGGGGMHNRGDYRGGDNRNNNNRGGGGGNNFNSGGGGGGGDDNNNNNSNRMDRKGGPDGRNMQKSEGFMIFQRLKNLQGPTHELEPVEQEQQKFSGRNRLYVGNLKNDTTEEQLVELFKPYGEIGEIFLNADKNFAFLKVDLRAGAEKAKRELDGTVRSNRTLRIRFAPNATTVRVKNLTPFVTNELLYKSFEIFGPLERAVIVVDDRGKPSGEGIVEFARKSSAMAAIRYCSERCYFLTASLRPCVCEIFEHSDETDGYPEKSVNKKNPDFYQAREVGPRFAEHNSFEHEYGTKWKNLHELYCKKMEALKQEMTLEEEKLEAQMEYARYEHETELLREQLRIREQDRDFRKSNFEMKERAVDEQRTRTEEQMRRQQNEMTMRMGRQEEELRRRQQENTLFMQAQQLNSLLDAQENEQDIKIPPPNMDGSGGGAAGGAGGNRKNYNSGENRHNFDMSGGAGGVGAMGNQDTSAIGVVGGGVSNMSGVNRFDDMSGGNMGGGGFGRGGGGQWNDQRGGPGGNNDFQNKRRRFYP